MSTNATAGYETPATTDASFAGPFPEFDAYGDYTGCDFVRCTDCGIEVLETETATATHRVGCSHE